MDDLPRLFEHLMAFVAVVDAGGFNAAGNRFGVPPSRLSRSIAALERQLGASLLVRTSRRFEVTDIGRRTYEDAMATRARLQDAVAAARESQGEPSGFLRVSCPMVLGSAVVDRIAIAFMARYPSVRVSIESTDGRSRPFSDPADLAIQPSLQPLRDSCMVARSLATRMRDWSREPRQISRQKLREAERDASADARAVRAPLRRSGRHRAQRNCTFRTSGA